MMMTDATAIVLAGGQSRRMGEDKSLIEIDGQPLIQRVVDILDPHFGEVIISAADKEKYGFLNRRVIMDREPGCGPLMGIYSGVSASQTDLNFVMACDMPDVDLDLMGRLLSLSPGYDVVMPTLGEGRFEPLFAVYRKSILPHAASILESHRRRIILLFDYVDVKLVPIDAAGRCTNLNTQDDLKNWKHSHDNV